jgi:protein-S-isoprenylcysteine O-methyltransferase Ste14
VALSWKRVRLRLPWLAVPLVLWLAHPNLMALELGGALSLLGLWIRAWAAGTILKKEELATTGPYAYTRNPLYLGSFLIGLGVSIATAQPIFVALTVLFFGVLYVRTAREEERVLEGMFGEEYREYRRAVPAFLPTLTPYRRGEAGFQFRRYLYNKEYQAALGVAVMMAALLGDYVWW